MNTRRNFLKKAALFSAATSVAGAVKGMTKEGNTPIVVSTWNHGMPANAAAWEVLKNSGKSIDAVESGVKIPEGDPDIRSVGYGGYPDRDGRVTLDACIMDEHQQCGSVACLEHIRHPIAVARRVMEKTNHVMLVGEGALEFALSQGFTKENLLTPATLAAWEKMQKEFRQKRSVINIENHDTIGMLAIDMMGKMSGACTTSGAANKLHGRVGDSPIIGAGLFVDNEIGAACATGLGEEVIKQAGSAMVVELMRSGMEPQQACKTILQRIDHVNQGKRDLQVGFLALRKDGIYGAYSLAKGFNFAVRDSAGARLVDAGYLW